MNITQDARSDSLQNPLDDLEQSSGFGSKSPSVDIPTDFDPLKASRNRKKQLPPSRYEISIIDFSSRDCLTGANQIPISTAKI